ncbi:hypothetical protein N7510_010669 [Penicillium lagena]|uniref:uncharacterized protein n=1 Tax=Penicillium lagena TaxID=94218 RepID=UPI002541A05E|nr:uncharacterized protein N7510_010669 [Penicillium lagena]KAJ5601135.1 hypothetical protein N7510_010669 [Penicillium lagena]
MRMRRSYLHREVQSLVELAGSAFGERKVPPKWATPTVWPNVHTPPVTGDWLVRQTPMLSAPISHSGVLWMWSPTGAARRASGVVVVVHRQ